MNFKKFAPTGVSLIAAMTYGMASAVNASIFGGPIPPMLHPTLQPVLPGTPFLPRNKHGCNKRGGRSKRGRNLNYWRR